ncbi:MAG: FmdE family protein [Arcobacteraceae bacterium]|nr:FmdE family protein [Arcobacteraceae bacterium]
MLYPEFFDSVEKIVLYEPLGEFLGSGGVCEIGFADVVKLSGHSCPTVTGAYLMSLYALKALHKENETPIRGNIKVEMRGKKSDGVVGVIANVVSYITGAKEEDGFKGLGGVFARNNLLFFNAKSKGEIRFTRLDTGKIVDVSYDLGNLYLPELDSSLMQKALQNRATQEETELFGKQWQARVKEILLNHKEKAIKIH